MNEEFVGDHVLVRINHKQHFFLNSKFQASQNFPFQDERSKYKRERLDFFHLIPVSSSYSVELWEYIVRNEGVEIYCKSNNTA